MNKVNKWLWGLVLIALGVILGINALGIMDINIFFPGWWTLFIIVPCFIGLFSNNDSKWADVVGIIVGVALLLACQGWLEFKMIWKLIVPVILIVLGLSMIFKDTLKKQVIKEAKKLHGKTKDKEYWAVFGGEKVSFAGEKFKGCRLEAVFGGVECDLTEAILEEDVMIKASAVFGGVTIWAPRDVNVKIISTSVFGGTTNKCSKKQDGSKKTLYIDATNVFGGLEVK